MTDHEFGGGWPQIKLEVLADIFTILCGIQQACNPGSHQDCRLYPQQGVTDGGYSS